MKLLHWISIGLLAFTAISVIVFVAAPWIKYVTKPFGDIKITTQNSLWGQSHSCDGSGVQCPDSKSWGDIYNEDLKDRRICEDQSKDVTGKDAFHAIQGAQAGGILSLLSAIVFAVVLVLHLCGKISKKFLIVIPAFSTVFFALLCFGMFMKFYNICPKSMCETAKDHGADSCGANAGVVFVWFAMIAAVVATVLALLRTPDALEGEGGYTQPGNQAAWGQPGSEPKTQYAAGSV